MKSRGSIEESELAGERRLPTTTTLSGLMRSIIVTITACLLFSGERAQSNPELKPSGGTVLYTFAYHVPQQLLDEKLTAEELKLYYGQNRLRALLIRIGIPGPPGASGSPRKEGLIVRDSLENHEIIRAYLTKEFGDKWRLVDPFDLEEITR